MLDLDLDEGSFWEEELCEPLFNFPITMEEAKKVDQRLYKCFTFKQVPTQRFHEDQPLPDNDPIPDHPDDLKKMNMVKLSCGEEGKKEEKNNKEKEVKKMMETELNWIPWSSFPQDSEGRGIGSQSDSRSARESDDSDFDDPEEEEDDEEEKSEMKKISLGSFLCLAVGAALVGGSFGYCRAR